MSPIFDVRCVHRPNSTDECTYDIGCVMQVKSSDSAAQSAADSDESDDEPIVKKLKVG